MIKKIARIKQFGVFQEFAAGPQLADFPTFNLLYGWNGRGKTTLSKLLHLLETKTADPELPNFELELVAADNTGKDCNYTKSTKTKIVRFAVQNSKRSVLPPWNSILTPPTQI